MDCLGCSFCRVVALVFVMASFDSCSPESNPLQPEPPAPVVPDEPESPGQGENPVPTATLTGRVLSADGTPLVNVVVSDGVEVVTTDADGNYSIESSKATGCVFVSVPSGYEAQCRGNLPQFFATLTAAPDVAETHDFVLRPVDQKQYTVIVQADQHLARRTDDLAQFTGTAAPDMNAAIDSLRSLGRRVYSLSLGDAGWEQFWTANNFDLTDAVAMLGRIDCPIFYTIGNHDNSPYIPDDWLSSAIFRENIAPDYYSFNIGEVHYVVLDNVVYNNIGATETTMGDRTYERRLTDAQFEWLARDLARVPHDTPLVVCAHVPFYSDPVIIDGTQVSHRNMLGMDRLEDILAPYADVTLFSGHYHRNYTAESPFRRGLTEHCVASVCGSLWWTARSGYTKKHLCTDGTPGGYGLLDVDGSHMAYRYKGIGLPVDSQFIVYDLNTTNIDEATVTNTSMKKYVSEYAGAYYRPAPTDDILVNVYNYGPGWTITVCEEGRELTVTRVRTKDPLHILAYECQRLSHGATPTATSTFITQESSHFFRAHAGSSTSTITVEVTDPQGRRYTQIVRRPKAFTINMQ